MTLLLPPTARPRRQPAPFQVIDGNALQSILDARPFQPEEGFGTMYRIRERLRGSKSAVDFAQEHLIAIRTVAGVPKLGVYRYDEDGDRPSELLVSFRLERLR